MPPAPPFRFGGGLFWAQSMADSADGARRLEAAGYDTLITGDHFSPTCLHRYQHFWQQRWLPRDCASRAQYLAMTFGIRRRSQRKLRLRIC